MTLGETFWCFGVFFKPMEIEFGWSRTLVSSGYTAFIIGYALSVVLAGRLADKYDPRFILLTTALLAGLGISLCSQIRSVDQLCVFLLVAGLGAGATWSVPTSTVQRWFYNKPRAGLALSTVVAGVGVGALIFAPLINYLILSYGWRNAYLVVGILFFVIIALSSLVIKRSPTNTQIALEREGNIPKVVTTEEWSVGRIISKPSFMGIAFATCAGVFAWQVVSVHLVPHATDVGITPTTSAIALGLIGGFSVPGRIISGFISEKIGWQKTMAISNFGMALFVMLLLFLKTAWMLYCFAFFYGTCQGIRAPTQVGILGQFFGMRSLGELIGINHAIAQLIGASAPLIAGFLFDTTGSYLIAFIIVIVLLLVASFAASIIKKPQPYQNK